MVTANRARALAIIDTFHPVAPDQFAHLYFPRDHEGWKRHTRAGHGTRKGGGLVLFAGGFLGKLRRAGLVRERATGGFRNYESILTPAGKAALVEYEACHGPFDRAKLSDSARAVVNVSQDADSKE